LSIVVNRKQFVRALMIASGAVAGRASLSAPTSEGPRGSKQPRAIAMWDFSWLERRWPGAGYENWDQALDELVERGYNAVRIDPYPHLVAAASNKYWLLKPVWDTQDWGAPTLARVRVLPELHEFIAKCRDRDIKVGLSSWFREDENDVRLRISGPEPMSAVWNTTLAGIERAGLLDAILYVDLCNEWPGPVWAPFVQPPLDWGQWFDSRAMAWMRAAMERVRAEFPQLPLLFSTNNERVEVFAERDLKFVDAIEHHLWMVGENNDEFYELVGYHYERFSEDGYHNLQLKGASLYAEKPIYWQKLLTDKIARLATAARRAGLPLMTTECWGIIDYKDWPLLPWDWVKEVCAIGARTASATGQWVAIATSNFCGPQFRGMWRDVDWHRRLTTTIKTGSIDPSLRSGRIYSRL
jgi:hypothetical protein